VIKSWRFISREDPRREQDESAGPARGGSPRHDDVTDGSVPSAHRSLSANCSFAADAPPSAACTGPDPGSMNLGDSSVSKDGASSETAVSNVII
jgi:hypothetical protein